jgi:hypothetical protein
MDVDRRCVLAGGAAVLAPLPQGAPGRDRLGRMTLPVRLNGQGPFRFALDSAASMSLVASDLADSLRLTPAGDIAMHTLLDREITPTVRADRVTSGSLNAPDVRMAVGSRAALAGLDGLISPGLLAQTRVVLNFRGRDIRIGRSRTRDQSVFSPERRVPYTSPVARAFKDLVILDAAIGGHRVKAILDTGAGSTVCNSAMAEFVGAVAVVDRDGGRTRTVQSATGKSAEARTMLAQALHFGPISLDRAPLLVGDFHAFEVWGLKDEPAMLLGVDVLGSLRSMVIDYGRRDVVFEV